MRVISLSDTFFPDCPGGLARVAWDVAKALARRGHDVAMIAGFAVQSRSSNRRPALDEKVEGVRVFRYARESFSRLDPFRASKQVKSAIEAVSRVLALQDWDVIHSHSILTAAAALKAAPHMPRLQTVHSPAVEELTYNWNQQGIVGRLTAVGGRQIVRRLESRAVRTAARCHALSRFTVEQMTMQYPRVRQDYTVIPHWADNEWFRVVTKEEARARLGWPKTDPIVFTVRQLRHRYGIDTAIQAVAPLARAGRCRLYIGGSGVDAPLLSDLIDTLGVRGGIELLGRMSDDDLRLAYQAADLFVLPTRALECFGLIIFEALACGLPVIGTDVGAIPENLAPILPNCIVPADNPTALRGLIEQFLYGGLDLPSDHELASYVREYYSESRIMQAYESLLAEVVRK